MFFAEKIDVLGFGWMYEAILVMLFLVSAVDAVSIVKSLKSGGKELKEYAQLCIKYLKILMCIFAGGFFLLIAATYTEYDTATRAIHGVLGVLLLLDAAVSLWLKLKYRRKAEK